ncbi:2-polyprenyl-6-methoxyphenol hydroxylase-like FAD-dependent oxidoreductase [Stackebrandtia endophytica]|uniref:2-polyprenyl-6-methoxyphenol hydroxylase-like FAD-dependent oxidoreductase n=1 Tax=Stackebrandtia endophytica TaxID=1496996 RepID=A0A543ARU7_9ACTN|nr:2-polyprenyl-6-methoxyphenol hydroxylase-like FAD-dependent oxidoreductase [Stackebrandtia endophytica]
MTTLSTESHDRFAVISGAGIAGLAAALRLRRAGWRTLIVERAPERRSSGYLVNLLGYGYGAAENLGILPQLAPHDVGLFTTILVDRDGRHKLTTPRAVAEAAIGPRALSVFRGDLETVLYQAVRDHTPIKFDTVIKAVSSEPDGVALQLSDGTTQHADLLIGADGLHSGVRRLVFGPDDEFRNDMGHLVGAFQLSEVPGDLPVGTGTTFIGPGRTGAVINLGPRRSSVFFTYRSSDVDSALAAGPVAALTDAFGDLGGGFPEALDHLRREPAEAYFDSVDQIVMNSWSRGRVVLLGDAAWCVTLFAGYGAALALTGADRLGDLLERSDVDVPDALARWESQLRPEVSKRQALAARGMARFAPANRTQVWLGETMLRAMNLPGIRQWVIRSVRRANGR